MVAAHHEFRKKPKPPLDIHRPQKGWATNSPSFCTLQIVKKSNPIVAVAIEMDRHAMEEKRGDSWTGAKSGIGPKNRSTHRSTPPDFSVR